MVRNILRFLLLIGLAFGITAPALFSSSETDSSQGAVDLVTVETYSANYAVTRDGTVEVTEKITGNFPKYRHGIFRYWDLSDAKNRHVRFIPKNIQISLDSQDVPFKLSWEQGRRFRVAKIGDPDIYLTPGLHTYEISYKVPGAISPEKKGSRFEWQVIPGGWGMPINQAFISVTLPEEATDSHCRIGTNAPCSLTIDGRTMTISIKDLAPYTEVRLAALMDMSAPEQVTRPWGIAWDQVMGTSAFLGFLALIASAGTAVYGFVLAKRSQEEPPGLPVSFAPPEGLSPVQTKYIVDETPGKDYLVATMMYLAEQKVISLKQDGASNWTITSEIDAQTLSRLDPVSRAFGTKLGILNKGKQFHADGSVASGMALKQAQEEISTEVGKWARSSGFTEDSWKESLAAFGAIGAAIVAGVLLFVPIPSIWAAPFGMFTIGAFGLFASGTGQRRTQTGRELWSRAGGFKRFLSTPSAEDRFHFSERTDLYATYIPFAIAFGVADAWAQRYTTAMAAEPPAPDWLPVHAGMSPTQAIASTVSSFDSAVSSSISAYQATQSSSSGGGGGGFSGGGGGGGGGGSW